jgi:hypothetical protein
VIVKRIEEQDQKSAGGIITARRQGLLDLKITVSAVQSRPWPLAESLA